ncbi:MAG: hypothetical protein K6G64_02865 [Eubacterium sp.]|nr:hypothetical protein [Eubacterium sp.]
MTTALNKLKENWQLLLILPAIIVLALFIHAKLNNAFLIYCFAGLVALILIAAACFPEHAKKIMDFCFRYRWGIALAVFLFCIIFRLSGSSIGIYNQYFPTQITTEKTTLFGTPRQIRSDEFGVSTMKFFSQSYNNDQFYSTRMSLSPTNMVLDYYSPVRDITALGKPMMWGYLLFGNEIGISWYWCGEIILIFMFALEVCLILTRRKRALSFVGAIMITWAPEIQWLVMPHMPIVILYAMALFCTGYWFFTAKTTLWKWISTAAVIISAIGFSLSIFPAFQVPCAYVVAPLLTVCLIRDKEHITLVKKDWIRFLATILPTLGVLLYFVIVSRNDLSLLLNTAYPGQRVVTGKDCTFSEIFTNLGSIFLPYFDSNYSNNCELATYIHFAPFFFLLSPRLLFHLKKSNDKDWIVGTTLILLMFAELFFMLVGIPEDIAKLTFLHFCNRMRAIYDWTATLFTVWGIGMLLKYPDFLKKFEKILYPAVYVILAVVLQKPEVKEYLGSIVIFGHRFGIKMLLLITMALFVLLLLLIYQQKRLFFSAMVMLMVLCGFTVNPIEVGSGAVTNHPISATIRSISEKEPESRWLCTDCAFPISNFILACGAKSLDATNFYPDPKKWEIIDPDSKYEEFTNRYANQFAYLTTEESSVELIAPDLILLHLNPETLKKLNIKYIVSMKDYTKLLEQYQIECNCLSGQDQYGIYQLTYSEQ